MIFYFISVFILFVSTGLLIVFLDNFINKEKKGMRTIAVIVLLSVNILMAVSHMYAR